MHKERMVRTISFQKHCKSSQIKDGRNSQIRTSWQNHVATNSQVNDTFRTLLKEANIKENVENYVNRRVYARIRELRGNNVKSLLGDTNMALLGFWANYFKLCS